MNITFTLTLNFGCFQVMRGLLNSLSSLKQWTGDIFLKNNSINRIVMSFEAVAAEFTQRLPYPYNFTIPGQIVFTAESVSSIPINKLLDDATVCRLHWSFYGRQGENLSPVGTVSWLSVV